MSEFTYAPAACVPFKDREVVERVRRITRAEITNHPNPDFRISVIPDDEVEFLWITDMFYRIKSAADEGRRIVMIVPQPVPSYKKLAQLLNRFRVQCSHLYTFNMDEYADEDGHIAPLDWKPGFGYAMMSNFYANLDADLRPPAEQLCCLTDETFPSYAQRMEDLGGVDICYSGPGWTGHLAFIEPDAPELPKDLEEWKRTGPSIVTLSPITIAQNSMSGPFGMAGDLAAVPPKAATIGPAQVIASKERMDFSALTVNGSFVSWQRFMTRLVAHGPVTPLVPTSIHQTLRTDYYISETVAADIEPDWVHIY
jgi:6-phosphogluconolactonase/glucosamine-6-phosphate isomerase/deaminase